MATRLTAAPSRIILDLLKQHGNLTRKQLFELVPRDAFPTKERLKKTLSFLKSDHRVVPFLPVGSVKGVDNFVYKLNPMMTKQNFPEATTKKRALRIKELQYVLSLADGEPIVGIKKVEEPSKPASNLVMGDDTFDLSKE